MVTIRPTRKLHAVLPPAASPGPSDTIDRSVLGIMVDFAKSVPNYLDVGEWDDCSLDMVEDRLAETPYYAGKASDRVIFPNRKTPELLAKRWAR